MSHEIRLHHENSIEIANKIQHVINTKIIDEPRSPINIRGLNPELSFSPKKKSHIPMAAPNGRFASISHWENAITLTERRIPEITRPSCGSYADRDHEKTC